MANTMHRMTHLTGTSKQLEIGNLIDASQALKEVNSPILNVANGIHWLDSRNTTGLKVSLVFSKRSNVFRIRSLCNRSGREGR